MTITVKQIHDIPDWQTAVDIAIKDMHISQFSDFQTAARIIGKATELLLISKNEKYGKGNILNATKFGVKPEQALLIRDHDKTERIIQHFKNDVDLGKEGLIESFGDKMGYAAIGMMLQLNSNTPMDNKEWYSLPIKYTIPDKGEYLKDCKESSKSPQLPRVRLEELIEGIESNISAIRKSYQIEKSGYTVVNLTRDDVHKLYSDIGMLYEFYGTCVPAGEE